MGRRKQTQEVVGRRRQKKARREWLTRHKETLKCSICGFSFKDRSECCDFHHAPKPAERPHALYVATSTSDKALKAELKKTIPVCANCHRTVHKK